MLASPLSVVSPDGFADLAQVTVLEVRVEPGQDLRAAGPVACGALDRLRDPVGGPGRGGGSACDGGAGS